MFTANRYERRRDCARLSCAPRAVRAGRALLLIWAVIWGVGCGGQPRVQPDDADVSARAGLLLAELGQRRLRHARFVNTVRFSRDSRYLLSVGDAAVLISDAQNGEPVGRIALAGGRSMRPYDPTDGRIDLQAYHSPVISANEAYVAAFDAELRLAIWDARRGRALGRFEERGLSLRGFSADGRFLLLDRRQQRGVAVSSLLVKLPEVEVLASLPLKAWRDRGQLAVFSAEGEWMAAAMQQGRVAVIEVATGQQRFSFVRGPNPIAGMAFSADARKLAVAGGDDARAVRVFDVTEGRPLVRLFAHDQPVTSLAWSADGSVLATSSLDGSVRLWDGQELRLRRRIEVDGDRWRPVSDVNWSADGRLTAVALADSPTVRVYRIDPQTLFHQRLFEDAAHEGWVSAARFSTDGSWLITGSRDRTLRLWRLADGQVERTWHGPTSEVEDVAMVAQSLHAVDRAGHYVAFGWPGGEPLLDVPRQRRGRPPPSRPAAISPSGAYAAFIVEEAIRVIDTALQQSVTRIPLSAVGRDGSQPWRIAVSNEAMGLAVVHADRRHFDLWNVNERTPFVAGPLASGVGPLHDVTFSWDGRFVAVAGQGGVEAWHVVSGRRVWRWQPQADGRAAVLCVRFDAAGRRVALGLANGAIELLNAQTGEHLSQLPQRDGYVLSLAFDETGERLVAGYSDAAARLWRLPAMEAATAADQAAR